MKMSRSPNMALLRPLRQTSTRYTITPHGRFASSQPPVGEGAKPISPHVGFYKTFARPIAKVLLMATFTYQFSYWLWVKLEKDEIKSERQNEIIQLENQLQEVMSHAKQS